MTKQTGDIADSCNQGRSGGRGEAPDTRAMVDLVGNAGGDMAHGLVASIVIVRRRRVIHCKTAASDARYLMHRSAIRDKMWSRGIWT
jgi:hypothetical protein